MVDTPDSPNLGDRELLAQLKLASKDLLWYSEAEYPWHVFYWHDADTFDENTLLQTKNYASTTKIVVRDISSFFDRATTIQTWHNNTEKLEVRRYQDLVNLMTENLNDIKVYLLEEVEIDAYILGRTKHKAIAGLMTKIVAT